MRRDRQGRSSSRWLLQLNEREQLLPDERGDGTIPGGSTSAGIALAAAGYLAKIPMIVKTGCLFLPDLGMSMSGERALGAGAGELNRGRQVAWPTIGELVRADTQTNPNAGGKPNERGGSQANPSGLFQRTERRPKPIDRSAAQKQTAPSVGTNPSALDPNEPERSRISGC
jgi:hypothetical protein